MVVAAGVCGEVVQAGFRVAAGSGLSGSVVRVGAAVWVCGEVVQVSGLCVLGSGQ